MQWSYHQVFETVSCIKSPISSLRFSLALSSANATSPGGHSLKDSVDSTYCHRGPEQPHRELKKKKNEPKNKFMINTWPVVLIEGATSGATSPSEGRFCFINVVISGAWGCLTDY